MLVGSKTEQRGAGVIVTPAFHLLAVSSGNFSSSWSPPPPPALPARVEEVELTSSLCFGFFPAFMTIGFKAAEPRPSSVSET